MYFHQEIVPIQYQYHYISYCTFVQKREFGCILYILVIFLGEFLFDKDFLNESIPMYQVFQKVFPHQYSVLLHQSSHNKRK
jgi:predicted permease